MECTIDEIQISLIDRYQSNFIPVRNFEIDEYTILSYKFNEGSNFDTPSFAIDISGNGNHGNIYGQASLVENIYGCTDLLAINYNSDASIDDGSCEYSNHYLSYSQYGDNVEINPFNLNGDFSISVTAAIEDNGTGAILFEQMMERIKIWFDSINLIAQVKASSCSSSSGWHYLNIPRTDLPNIEDFHEYTLSYSRYDNSYHFC